MKAMVVTAPKSPLRAEDRPTPKPGPGEVRIRVHACGVCHSDHFVVDGVWPGLVLPRIPGHEVAGVIDAIGEGVSGFAVGDRVGVGWHGRHDGTCAACLRGQFMFCARHAVTGIDFDGGYAEEIVVPAVAVARIPSTLGFAEAAPLLCAGVTTFNALRNAGARPGDLVAVQGLGGLGHLGVQYAEAMGFEVAAIARGAEKEPFARELGAALYIDSERVDPAQELARRGGARIILATAPAADAISKLVAGLGVEGCLLVVAAPFEPLAVGAIDLIARNARVQGWSSGTASDSNDAMAFAAAHGVRPMIESYPLSQADAAYARMMSGKARFRAVLEMGAPS
ncbi:MAG TPA: alcohol dehydrogenase catalytic domain-containing protein [Myxococcota bacterium]|nr:alcohol dehydrogenase catalytic domain-containing protein [Myxococcota bacterium]